MTDRRKLAALVRVARLAELRRRADEQAAGLARAVVSRAEESAQRWRDSHGAVAPQSTPADAAAAARWQDRAHGRAVAEQAAAEAARPQLVAAAEVAARSAGQVDAIERLAARARREIARRAASATLDGLMALSIVRRPDR